MVRNFNTKRLPMSSSIRRASLSDAVTFKLTSRSSLAGFSISILVGGGALPPPIGLGTWCRRRREQLATSWGSTLYQLISTYQNENLRGKLCCTGCTRTISQCIFLHAPDQGFPNSVEGWGKVHPSGGEWEILLKES